MIHGIPDAARPRRTVHPLVEVSVCKFWTRTYLTRWDKTLVTSGVASLQSSSFSIFSVGVRISLSSFFTTVPVTFTLMGSSLVAVQMPRPE